ncbi:uncharacterized protein LOC112682735 [Sipha flava]|uniref:Uncharacterized protein LOC112682735 n=1 Tax=Sipha flava TaxID=143950 RepID=A0A8B8FEP1_9HEMI|nr:uncharacterized protein LOC112682735 [Sipha flava]
MDDENLIEKVRLYDELYNMAHKKYSDNHHKDIIWMKIGKELNTTGQACKNRWISLRDQLRKAIKKKKTKSVQAADIQKKWKYEDCMSFVIPFFKERETYSNILSLESACEESNDENISNKNDNTTNNDVLNEDEESEKETTLKRKVMESQKKMKISASYYSKKKKNNKPQTASSVLMKYILGNETNDEPNATFYKHPIDTFFQGLAATVKTFSPEYQHMAKNKVFGIVSDLEWAQLQNKSANPQIPLSINPSTSYFCSNTQVAPSQNTIQYIQTPTPSPISRPS